MSNLEDHEREQERITALCEAGECDHPKCTADREVGTRYVATIRHHSIASARVEPVGDTLRAAKHNALAEFGDGYRGHVIEIMDTSFDVYPRPVVASRMIGDRWWKRHDVQS